MDSRQAGADLSQGRGLYSFGYLLRRLRKAADLTQQELGRRVGCAADTIHKFESELRRPSQATAERLADALALSGSDRDTFVRIARSALAPDQLGVPDRPNLAPERSLSTARDNLPHQATAFIGREPELQLLVGLLVAPATRLVTICGLGGSGKTRLALAAAEQIARADAGEPRFADGICFVSLGGLSSSAQLGSAVASALGLSLDRGPRSVRHQLLDYLRHRQLLLILDNYDHLIEDVDLITQIVADAPGLTLLVTARERLQLHCEYLLMLEGLAAPACDADPETGAYDAVRLFLQVAEHAHAGYTPTADDLQRIGAICRLVEGLPLAIEMAAAWVAVLSPPEILAELHHGMDLLTTDLRDVPERQRSVRAVCATACRRLSPAEREAYLGLSAFRGGFTLEAARAVAGADHALLATLVGHALLRHDPLSGRFSFHELLRQYAAERLAADASREAVIRGAHAAYYLRSLARHASGLQGEHQLEALAAISADDENTHAAWDWAVSSGLVPLLDVAADGLGHYYEWQGYLNDGEHAFRVAAEAASGWEGGAGGLRLQARLLAWHGSFQAHEGPNEAPLSQSLDLLQRAATLGEDGCAERAFALWRLARLRAARGDGDAVALYGQSLALYRSLGHGWELSLVLCDLGDLLLADGRFADAEDVLAEAQVICERAGDRRGLARTLQLLSLLCFETDRLEEAEGLARRSHELAQAFGGRGAGRGPGARGRQWPLGHGA